MLRPFIELLGERSVLTAPDDVTRSVVDHRELMHGGTLAVLRPRSVEHVQEVVRLAAHLGLGLVPQGGNTSYVGGATPEQGRDQLVLSLELLSRVRSVDPLDFTMSCDAGGILADAQREAEKHGLLFHSASDRKEAAV